MMYKSIYGLLTVLVFFSCSGKEIHLTTEKTPLHRLLENTNAYMVPPANYQIAESYSGFQDRGANYSISIKPEDRSIHDLDSLYTRKFLKEAQMELLEKNPVLLNGEMHGLWLKVLENRRDVIRYILAIDTGQKIWSIKGTCHETADEYFGTIIRQTMQGVFFVPQEEIDEEENAPLVVFSDHFRYAGLHGEEYKFTKDGKYPTASPDSACFSYYKYSGMMVIAHSAFAKAILNKELGKSHELVSEKKVRVEDMNGWTMTAFSPEKDKLVYAAYLYRNASYHFKGVCTANFDENLKKFRESLFSVQRK